MVSHYEEVTSTTSSKHCHSLLFDSVNLFGAGPTVRPTNETSVQETCSETVIIMTHFSFKDRRETILTTIKYRETCLKLKTRWNAADISRAAA